MQQQSLTQDDIIIARLEELQRAVASLAALQTLAPFETTIRVTADFGMRVEAALTPKLAERLRAGLPLLETDEAGRAVRRLKLFDGRFTLEWPFRKHTHDRTVAG